MSVQAQSLTNDPDWKETEVPAPPKFDPKQRIVIDMPHYVSMEFGVDPTTLTVTADGIVRYVMLAISPSNAITAFYEGIRCATGEVKGYARSNAAGGWTLISDPEWRGLNDKQPSKHALALARQGACEGHATGGSAAEILKKIKGK